MQIIQRLWIRCGHLRGNEGAAGRYSAVHVLVAAVLWVWFFPMCTTSAQNAHTLAVTSIHELSGATISDDPTACRQCHEVEVEGYDRSTMGHSLRPGGREPPGSVTTSDVRTTFEKSSDGTRQVPDSVGYSERFPVYYVTGSGTHASGYLMDIGDHLFQSPIACYRSRRAYGPAPGFEVYPDPDFTRPVTPGCLFCHAVEAVPVSGSGNEYASSPFHALAIGCSRCHGSPAARLVDPGPGNIINPARLSPAARIITDKCRRRPGSLLT